MTVRGTSRIDGIVIGEFTAVFLGEKSLRAKAAFVNSRTGSTHGWTNNALGWSPETLAKLQELRELMELDLAKIHFETDTLSGASTVKGGLQLGTAEGGIGEHLGSSDVPSV